MTIAKVIHELAASLQHMDMEVHHRFAVDGWAYLLGAFTVGVITAIWIRGPNK